jgi:hypothetical protein
MYPVTPPSPSNFRAASIRARQYLATEAKDANAAKHGLTGVTKSEERITSQARYERGDALHDPREPDSSPQSATDRDTAVHRRAFVTCSLEDIDRIGSDVDFDLFKPLKQDRFVLGEELLVFRSVINIDNKAEELVFVAGAFVNPDAACHVRLKTDRAKLGD